MDETPDEGDRRARPDANDARDGDAGENAENGGVEDAGNGTVADGGDGAVDDAEDGTVEDAETGGDDDAHVPPFEATTDTPAKGTALACLRAGVAAAHPERVVRDAVTVADGDLVVEDTRYDLDDFDRVVVLGGGKAGDGVANALVPVLGDRLTDGAVVTPDPEPTDGPIARLRGDHPVPTEAGVRGAARVAELARAADERTLVLAVITGGASALLPAPAEGVSLADLRATTEALLESGADIGAINAVRKHLSTLKGGGLARLASPATVVTLAFSDVVGSDLAVIGSGPTVPDPTTFADALSVVAEYGVDVPPSVRERLERGAAGDLDETPKPGDPVFDRVHTHVLADTFTALDAAREAATARGYRTCILSSRITGEARGAAGSHVAVAAEALATGNPVEPPAVVLSGGECTVTVRESGGRGGPNQEFALAAALDLPAGATLASMDSDGIDGASDAAGAVVDADTVADGEAARDALARNDAGTVLNRWDALVHTGPTGTNVNDVRALVVEETDAEEG